jgi:hypothetical protein
VTSINNHQITTVIFAIALAGLLLVGMSAVGNGQTGGGSGGGQSSGSSNSLLVDGSNTGINVQTDTNQKQDCETAGETSPITTSCTASSTNSIAQSGGILHK